MYKSRPENDAHKTLTSWCQHVLCVYVCMAYVQISVHLMCGVSVCVVCRIQYVSCVGLGLRCVQDLSMLRAVFSLCYVQSLVCAMSSLQSRTSALRSEHASLRSGRAQQVYKGRAEGNAKYQILCAGPPFIFSVQKTNEKVSYIYIYTSIYTHGSVYLAHLARFAARASF